MNPRKIARKKAADGKINKKSKQSINNKAEKWKGKERRNTYHSNAVNKNRGRDRFYRV